VSDFIEKLAEDIRLRQPEWEGPRNDALLRKLKARKTGFCIELEGNFYQVTAAVFRAYADGLKKQRPGQ